MSEVWNPVPGGKRAENDIVISMVDVVPVGGVVVAESGDVLHVNGRASELLGFDVDETDLEAIVSESRTVRPEGLHKFLEGALARPPECSFHLVESSDGSVRCIEVTVQLVAAASSPRVCWFRDATDSQQLRQFRLLAEIGRSSGGKPSTRELAGRLVDAILEALNLDIAVMAVRERDGLRPVAARGMMFEDGYVLDPTFHPYVQKAIESGKPVVSDGSEWESGELAEVTGLHYVVPLTDSGEVVGTLHLGAIGSTVPFQTAEMARNASRFTLDTLDAALLDALSAYAGSALANVRLFDEIRNEQAKLRTVVDSIPEGLVVYNSRGEVLIANCRANELVEFEWTNLNTDVRPYRLCSPDGRALPRGEWPFFRAVRTGEPVRDEVVVMDFGDAKKYVEINVVPVRAGDLRVASFVATLQDVTRRSEIQRRREEFVSVASHELRSPLTPLSGFLQMLGKQAAGEGPVDVSLVRRAQAQVARLTRLIETLLDATRIDTGRVELEREPIDLRVMVQRFSELWGAHTRPVTVAVDVPPHPVIARVDGDRVDQVLTNVLENAVKHSPPASEVRLSLNVDEDAAVLRVSDRGDGIDPDVLPQVFERFFSTGEGGRGLGLGLYISRQIVERHGGTIEIDSEPGDGAEVTIRLPLDPH